MHISVTDKPSTADRDDETPTNLEAEIPDESKTAVDGVKNDQFFPSPSIINSSEEDLENDVTILLQYACINNTYFI